MNRSLAWALLAVALPAVRTAQAQTTTQAQTPNVSPGSAETPDANGRTPEAQASETQPAQAPGTQPAQAPETQPAQAPGTQPAQAPEAQPVQEPRAENITVTTVKGIVRAKGATGRIKDAAVIDLANRENATTTDAQGAFSLTLGSADGKILVRAAGYEDQEISFTGGVLPEGGDVRLEPAPELLGVGIIRARRKTEVSQQSLQRDELTRIPGTGGDAVRGLQTLPSVLPANVGSADIVVRGSAPGDNRYFVDRLELPFVFHLGGLGTVVPTRMLEGIDLYPGGFSALYGNATGGVVQLRTENRTPDRTSGQFELGLIQSSLYLEGNFGGEAPSSANADAANTPGAADAASAAPTLPQRDERIGYRAGFRRTYLEVFSPIIKKAAGERATFITLPQATDYQFLLNGTHARGTWQAYLIGAANRLAVAASTNITDEADGQSSFSLFNYFETAGVRYNFNLGDGWGLSATAQQRYTIIDQRFFDNVVDVRAHRFTVDVALDRRFSPQWSATVGVRPEYETIRTRVDALQIPARGFGPFFDPDTAPRSKETSTVDTTSGQVYVDVNWRPTKSFLLNPGVNVLQGARARQTEFDPRVAARFGVSEEHTLKAAWGYYSQRPQPYFDSKTYGNPNLELERAIHTVAGVESKFGQDWETDLQLYNKDILNLVGPALVSPEEKYDNTIKGRAKGVEVFIKKQRTGRWYGWLAYSYSKSERQDPGSKIWRLSDYDRPHAVKLLGAYRITGQWEVSSKAEYLSGQPYTVIDGGTFNQNTGRYVPRTDGNTSLIEKNDGRLPAYFQLNARTDYDILYDSWKLNLYLDVQNVTNRENVVGFRYTPDYARRQDVTGTPIIPSIGAIASF